MSDLYTSSDVQAGYWLGNITRKEAQGVYDEFASAIGNVQGTVMKLDAAVAYMFEKLGLPTDDFEAWLKAKAELADAAAKQPSIITE